MTTLATAPPAAPAAPPRWLAAIDRWTERGGDWLNPILVKEARQALKSRQFLVTFSLLLLTAWGWTAAAIMMMMPRIYYVPSGQTLLMGYYVVLAVPMLLVVPLAAHRSLAVEIDDGTLDLLSVTNLSPLQIITGKLASAALQMMLYFVALVPCVAFCYVLRGVDLLTIAMLLGMTLVVATLLTVVGLFLAALPKGRSGQLGMLIAMLVIVVIAEFSFGSMAMELISEGFGESVAGLLYAIVTALVFTTTVAVILLVAAAAQLSPPSENRSTPLRLALLVHQTLMTGCLAYGLLAAHLQLEVVVSALYYAAILWAVTGALMVGESSVLTPRIRRDLPATFAGRAVGAWFIPGPGTGLVFAVGSFLTFALLAFHLVDVTFLVNRSWRPPVLRHVLILGGYLMLFLSMTRWLMQLVRTRSNPHPSFSIALLAIVMGAAAVAPFSVALHYHDYRQFPWSYWQVTNWAWTTTEIANGKLGDDVPYLIFGVGATAFALSLVTLGRAVLPQRVATPERVLAERKRESADDVDDVPADPLAV